MSYSSTVDSFAFLGNEKVRKQQHDGERYFSVTDVVRLLTGNKDTKSYIKKIRANDQELKKKWRDLVVPLPLPTPGGVQKMNCANAQCMLRIIQSISSPQVESYR